MSGLRAQASLLFHDKDLYENFIEPLKENKELNSMIVRLLTAYYNMPSVRELVDGVSTDEMYDTVESKEQSDLFNDIRQLLSVQSFLYDEVSQTLDDGVSDMEKMMHVNEAVQKSGVVKTEQTGVGKSISSFLLEKSENLADESHTAEASDSNNLTERVSNLESSLGKIMSILTDMQSNGIKVSTSQEITPEEPKNMILNSQPVVPLTPKEPTVEKISEPIPTPTPTVVAEPVILKEKKKEVVPEVTEISQSEDSTDDASDMISDVLADLFG